MALSSADVWPLEVRYAWSDGADLVAQSLGRGGEILRSEVAVRNADLDRRPWSDLPLRDSEGRPIRYTIDAPGDDKVVAGRTRWRRRMGELTASGRYRPTQYAHLFWHDREEGLLAIQYWFFYPFNEWVNHHEGDWEHINVVLRGPRALVPGAEEAFVPVGYQFFFHGFRHDTEAVVRAAGGGGDHVVVFTGGRGRFLWWTGSQSGASYPLPAIYPDAGSGPFAPDEDTRAPARFIAAAAFQVIVLPEPHRLDARAHPELSWLRLPFYAGQGRVSVNPPFVDRLGHGGPPLQPAWRVDWNGAGSKPLWRGTPVSGPAGSV